MALPNLAVENAGMKVTASVGILYMEDPGFTGQGLGLWGLGFRAQGLG